MKIKTRQGCFHIGPLLESLKLQSFLAQLGMTFCSVLPTLSSRSNTTSFFLTPVIPNKTLRKSMLLIYKLVPKNSRARMAMENDFSLKAERPVLNKQRNMPSLCLATFPEGISDKVVTIVGTWKGLTYSEGNWAWNIDKSSSSSLLGPVPLCGRNHLFLL